MRSKLGEVSSSSPNQIQPFRLDLGMIRRRDPILWDKEEDAMQQSTQGIPAFLLPKAALVRVPVFPPFGIHEEED